MQNGRMAPSEEKRALRQSDTSTSDMLRFVFGSVLKRKGLLVLNILLLTVIAGLNFLVPQYTQRIIDSAIATKSVSGVVLQATLLLGTVALLGFVTFASSYLMQVLSQRSITELRLQTYQQILRQDYAYFQNTKTGDLMVRLTSDINNLQSLISSNTFGIVGNIFTFVAVLSFLYYQNWQLAAMVSLTFPILFVTIRFFRSRMREAYAKVRSSQSEISNQLQNTLTEIELIKNYTSEDFETNRFEDIVERSNGYSLEATKWSAIFGPLVNFINTLSTAIVLLFGGIVVIRGGMTVGELVAYMSYVTLIQDPIRSFSQLLNIFQTAHVSYDRIQAVLGVKPTVTDAKATQDFPDPFKKGIHVAHLDFHYEVGTNSALHDVSLDVPAGKTTALVGRSGSGKSTLIKLLTRMYDRDDGELTYDDVPIEQIRMHSLRSNISVVSQDVIIVDGTVADNIRYGAQDMGEEALWQAAERADIADFIKTLPDGMATQVGERGVKLSGGQKQRLSIARALLKDAPIVILDEATAALDNESEKTIQHALDSLMVQKTSVVIAHRLSTVHNADQIIVMAEGSVVERGTHETLLAADGAYKRLYDAQFE
jgi:subfamily B ATP-binding cassette protein MsbA